MVETVVITVKSNLTTCLPRVFIRHLEQTPRGLFGAMDTLRGNFGSTGYDDGFDDLDSAEDEIGSEPPPASIGTDERRMQVRAYNHWASLLGDRNFPSIEDLEPTELPDLRRSSR